MSWKNASAGATVISGSVTNYAALPTPASSYSGQLWFVENPSQGLLSVLGIYKYPKGIYSPNSSNVWELMPLNVKVSEDAVTLVNITNWSEYIGYAFDIGAGDRLSYNSQTYRNLTGTQTSTAPDTDTTNWIVSGVQGENIAEFVYLKGNLSTDGSIRFSTFADSGDGIFQIRESGVWQPATMEFGTGSVFLGPRVGLAAFGHHVGTEDTYANHMHLHSHNVFNGELTTLGARIIKATSYVENIPLQGDYSGDVFTTNIEFTNTPPANMAFKNVKMKTGSSIITQPIRIQVWQGTDDTGPKIFDQVYPVSDFPTSSDISLVAKGWIQVNNGVTNFLRFSSDANMSFKTNAAMTMPYMAVNASYVQENDMLSNTPWVSGATFTVGQWAVQDEKIYICNTAGVQTGTFASNIALWDLLSSEGNDYWSRTGTVLSPKTAGDSVFIYEGANPICKLWDGDGNDAGTLSLYTGTTQYVHFSADEDSWITGGNFGIGDDDPLSDLHVRFNYAVPAVTVGLTLEQVGAGDCVTHYYLTGGQRVDTGIDNSTTNDDFVIGSGNFGVKYLSIDTSTNTVTVTNLYGNLSDGTTATTQSADDNSTKVATTAYVDTAVSAEDLWDRSGTTISPKTAGDDITTTGDLTAANITAGSNLGISQAGITNLVVGNTSGKSKLYFGQATNNNLVIEWTYNATPADASARITTWGYANDFYIDAKVLSLQTHNSAGQVGIGTDDPQAKLDVRGDIRIGDWTSADVYLTGVPSSGGDFNIGQTSGAGNVKIVSNVGTDLVIIQNDGDMGIGKVPTEKLDVNGTAQATILKANNGILDSSETEGDILAITGDSLTAGTAISINSLSSSDILRNLIEIRHSGSGNSTSAIDINLGASRGSILNGYSANTTQPGLRLDCNDLTYGAVAHFASTSADTNIRKLVHIQNSNALSTGTTGLVIDQASTGKAISTNGNITAGSYDGVLNDGVTATTQSTGDNSTKVATTAYADNVVSSEVYGSQYGQVLSIDFSQVGITTQYDKSPLVNNATGTSAGLVTSTGGAFGSGAILNGSTDYFTLASGTGLPTGAAVRTIEAYVKIDDITLQSGVIFRYGTETGDDVFSLEQIDAALRIFTNDDSSNTGNILSEGNWFLIQATYNGTQVNMWVNGTKVITNDAITVNTASGTTPYIGSRGGSSDYFDGNIDFVRVYDRVLTDDEIKVSYLRAGGDSVITSNAAKILNTSGESRNISGLDPAYAVDVFSLTDLPTSVAGVITLEAKMYVFHNIIVFSDRLVIPDNSTTILKMSEYGFNTYLLYTGTGTFITGASNAGLRIIDASIGMTGTGAKCFDVHGTVGIDFLSIICLGTSQTLGTLTGEAVSAETGDARFVARRTDFVGYDGGLTLTNLQIAVIDQVNFKQSSSSTSSSINIEGALSNPSAITSAVFSTGASGSCIDISPTIQTAISVNQSHNTGTGDYFTTGATGTFTAVADASVSAEAITSVTDSSGVARFNFSAPPTLFVYQEVVISGFTTNTAYNGTHIITATGTNYLEVSSIAYGSDETGSFLSNSVTLTDTGTSLSDGDTISIDTDESTAYDTGSYVYNKQTNSVQVNKTWSATATGTWDSGSLTQDSKYIDAHGNGDEEDSHNSLFAYVNTNATTTTFSLANTWYPVELGTVVSGLSTSRFKYVGNNTFKITTLSPLMGVFEANLTAIKTGSDKEYDFRINVTSGTGSFDSVIKEHTISSGISSFPVKASGFLQPGDEFQIEARVASTSQSEMTISGFNGEFK